MWGGCVQGLRMRIYIPQKITITVKNRLHSRQQPCRSPRQTVIGIGLRKISSKFCLPSVRAARRHCRCLAFRLFYFILCLFSVYTFFMRNPWGCVPVRPIYAYDYGRLRLRKMQRSSDSAHIILSCCNMHAHPLSAAQVRRSPSISDRRRSCGEKCGRFRRKSRLR